MFDRLFDDLPLDEVDSMSRGFNIEQMKDCVARDLEALLNSRTALNLANFQKFPLVERSIVSFGIQDFAGKSLGNVKDQAKICESIADAVGRHECRLRNVEVAWSRLDVGGQNLLFSVSAMLVLDPAMEAVTFDAVLHPMKQQYSVSWSRRATGLTN